MNYVLLETEDLDAHLKKPNVNCEEEAQPVLTEVFLQPSTAVAMLFSVPVQCLLFCHNVQIRQLFLHYYI